MAEDTSGIVVLGLVGTAVGVFAVDYLFSDKGESWIDQIFGKKEPVEEAHADTDLRERRADRGAPVAVPSESGTSFTESVKRAIQPLFAPPPASPDVVREVQSRLNSLGFPSFPGVKLPLDVDGLLGPQTKKMLAGMQKQWDLPVTSYPDPGTLRALRSITSSSAHAAPPPRAPRTLPQVLTQPVAKSPRKPTPLPKAPGKGSRLASARVGANIYDRSGNTVNLVSDESPLVVKGGPQKLSNGVLALPVIEAEHDGASGAQISWIGVQDLRTVPPDYLQHSEKYIKGPDSPCNPGMGWDSWGQKCVPTEFDSGKPVHHVSGHFLVGAGDWTSEVSSLGAPAVAILKKALDTESARTLGNLATLLDKAGFHEASAAAKAKAGSQSTTGFAPSFSFGGWGEPMPGLSFGDEWGDMYLEPSPEEMNVFEPLQEAYPQFMGWW